MGILWQGGKAVSFLPRSFFYMSRFSQEGKDVNESLPIGPS